MASDVRKYGMVPRNATMYYCGYLLWFFVWLGLSGSTAVSAETTVLSISYRDAQNTPLPEAQVAPVKSRMRLQVGKPLSRYLLRRSIEDIYALNDFVQVTVTSEEVPGGVHLRVLLEQKTRIRAIRVIGNQIMNREQILSETRFAVGMEYNATTAPREEQQLISAYQDRGYFQASVSVSAEQIEEYQVDLTVKIQEGQPTRISSIVFKGLQAFGAHRLRNHIRSEVGETFQQKTVIEDVKRLEKFYRDNGYLSVEIINAGPGAHDPVQNSVPVIFEIQEGVKLVVSIEGNDRISTDEIKQHLRILQNRYRYTDYTIRRNALDIERLYHQRGYSWVTVRSQVDRSNQQEVRVSFLIEEGEQFTVSQIEFHGNQAFPTVDLRGEMRTKTHHWLALPGLRWIFSRGIFDEEIFKTDIKALELFYRQQGYRSVQIRGEHDFDLEINQVSLNLYIDEGARTIVDQISFQGNQVFTDSQLMQGLRLHEGEPLNEDAANVDRAWIESRYQKKGYIRCSVSPEIREGHVIYHIDEGPEAVLGSLRLHGNWRTKAEVIQREFRLKAGEIYDAEEIATTRQRLFGLGLFRDVDFIPIPAEEKPERVVIDLDVNMTERSAGTINLRGGYSPSEKIRGTVELAHRNLYGRGRRLGSVFRVGTGGNLYELHFVEPWLFHTRTRAGIRVFRDRREELDNILATGGALTTTRRFQLGRIDHDIALQYRYEVLEHPDLARLLVSSIGTSLQRDTRDDPLDAANGSYHQFSVEYAGKPLGGNSDFIKLTTDHRVYFRQEDAVIALAARIGYGEGLRSTKEIVAAERFHAGGPYTLRGFRLFSLGEEDSTGNHSGDVMLILNAEIRFLIHGFLGGSFFVDVGNVWGELADLNPFRLSSDVGLGLRFATPIGPVRVDYGFPLVRRTSGGIPGKLWLVLGQAF